MATCWFYRTQLELCAVSSCAPQQARHICLATWISLRPGTVLTRWFRKAREPHYIRPTVSLDPLPFPPAAAADPLLKQIAVLPFLNVGPEDCESFSDGLTEDLIHTLSTCPGVRVVARAFSSEFKTLSLDMRTIGE